MNHNVLDIGKLPLHIVMDTLSHLMGIPGNSKSAPEGAPAFYIRSLKRNFFLPDA